MPGWLIVTLGGVGMALWYVGHCAWFPYGPCRRCGGDGKRRSSSGRSWRRCRRCRGTGERIRVGRRIWDAVARRRGAGRD